MTTQNGCSSRIVVSGEERDANIKAPTGRTFSDYASLQSDQVRHPTGLPLMKPPYSHITAIDMKTGENLVLREAREALREALDAKGRGPDGMLLGGSVRNGRRSMGDRLLPPPLQFRDRAGPAKG